MRRLGQSCPSPAPEWRHEAPLQPRSYSCYRLFSLPSHRGTLGEWPAELVSLQRRSRQPRGCALGFCGLSSCCTWFRFWVLGFVTMSSGSDRPQDLASGISRLHHTAAYWGWKQAGPAAFIFAPKFLVTETNWLQGRSSLGTAGWASTQAFLPRDASAQLRSLFLPGGLAPPAAQVSCETPGPPAPAGPPGSGAELDTGPGAPSHFRKKEFSGQAQAAG